MKNEFYQANVWEGNASGYLLYTGVFNEISPLCQDLAKCLTDDYWDLNKFRIKVVATEMGARGKMVYAREKFGEYKFYKVVDIDTTGKNYEQIKEEIKINLG